MIVTRGRSRSGNTSIGMVVARYAAVHEDDEARDHDSGRCRSENLMMALSMVQAISCLGEPGA